MLYFDLDSDKSMDNKLTQQQTTKNQNVVCIHHQIALQAKNAPTDVAVRTAEKEWSFYELQARVEQLGGYFQAQGLKPGDAVAVCLERNFDQLATILALFSCGVVYIPVDPQWPAARLSFVLEDICAVRLICESNPPVSIVEMTIPHLCPNGVKDTYEYAPVDIEVSQIAYVIYTSGSTGQPKGVQIEHRHLAITLESLAEVIGMDNSGVLPAIASSAFDISLVETLLPLMVGGSVLLTKKEWLNDPQQLIAHSGQMTCFHAVPSFMQVWLNAVEQSPKSAGLYPNLRTLLVGGDVVPAYLLERILRVFPDVELIELYGPTEATIITSWHRVTAETPISGGCIGRKFEYAEVYVMNRLGEVVPDGLVGELYIGGQTIARGYHNRKSLNEFAFVQHPQYGKLYRTGDMVRVLSDGRLGFLGRQDSQVKIRGIRVELGEVRNLLGALENVKDAAVVVRAQEEDKQLVAFCVAESGADLSDLTAEVRRRMAEAAPAHLVPSQVVVVESLPLNVNGKVDNKALLALLDDSCVATDFAAPQDERQSRMCDIWAEVLKRDRVGIYDSFFELGGDSIISIKLVSRMRAEGIEYTVKQLFEAECIAGLTRLLSTEETREENIARRDKFIPLVAQHKFLTEYPGERDHFNQSLLLTVPPEFQPDDLNQLISALLQKHDTLRLRFEIEDGRYIGHYHAFKSSLVERATAQFDLSAISGADLADTIAAHNNKVQSELSLNKGDMFRAVYYNCGTERPGRLLLVMHHLIVDGVSWRIILADLVNAYEQLKSCEGPLRFTAATASLQQWSDYLERYKKSDSLLNQQAFWRKQLSGAVKSLIPDNELTGPRLFDKLSSRSIELDEATTNQLLTKAGNSYRTRINELLLSGLFIGLRKFSGGDAFRIDMEGHGREALPDCPDISETLGWFTSQYPLRLSCESNALRDVICTIKETCRAIPDNGIGYELLADKLDNPMSGNLQFNYLGQFDQSLDSHGLFGVATESRGDEVGSGHCQSYRLIINGKVIDGRLQFTLSFHRDEYHVESIERLAQEFKKGLCEVIEHCSKATKRHTPADFPLAKVTQKQLDDWQYEPIEDIYPATPMQQGMLFHGMLEEDVGAYVSQTWMTLSGPVDIGHFRTAWQQVVARHEIFRTAFAGFEDQIVQLVYSDVTLPWHHADWRSLDNAQQQAAFEAYRHSDKQRGFDFNQPPLMRFAIWQLAEKQFRILWTHHHALLDGWCISQVFAEVMACYKGLTKGQAVNLPAVRPFRDYLQWLHERPVEKALEWWQSELATMSEPTRLEYGQSGSDVGIGFREVYDSLDPMQTAALEKLCRNIKVTQNTLIQAAWGYLLSRCTGQSDVVFGATVSGRPATLLGVEDMIGLFINTIAVRVQGKGDVSLVNWLVGLHRRQIEANEYSYVALSEVQRRSFVNGEMFNSIVVFENYPVSEQLESEAQSAINVVDNAGLVDNTTYDYTLTVLPGESLKFNISYRSRLLSKEGARRLMDYFKAIVVDILENSLERKLSDLLLMSPQDEQRLVVTQRINAEQINAAQSNIHSLFETHAAQNPGHPAVVYQTEQLSYGELNDQASQLAAWLHAQQVGVGDTVVLCLSPSVDLMVAVLGVLKAGAAYVPISTETPDERVALVLEESRAPVLFCDEKQVEQISQLTDCTVTCTTHARQAQLLDDVNIDPASVAYICFTSGSTGKPKGVEVTHSALTSIARCWQQSYDLESQSHRILQMANISFDVFAGDWIRALTTGNTLVMCPRDALFDAEVLYKYLVQHKITIAEFVPAILKNLTSWLHQANRRLDTLKLVIAGADRWTGADNAQVKSLLGADGRVVNSYGVTEAAIDSTWFEASAFRGDSEVPIGSAFANTTVFVVGEDDRPVPPGVKGELLLGGLGLARGYLNRPELTAEKFAHVTLNGQVQRVYRTGDLVQMNSQDQLVFLGRKDFQIKLNGQRIELGEIEAQLKILDSVKDAVVSVSETDGHRRLVAYAVREANATQWSYRHWVEQITTALVECLPHYMVPKIYVEMNTLPLSANGKIDRKELPEPNMDSLLQAQHLQPQSDLEAQLCSIWQSALGIDQVGIEDNFFALGGDSIIAIQVAARAKKMGLHFSVPTLFECPTVIQLAPKVKQGESYCHPQEAVTGPMQLLPVQLEWLERSTQNPHHFNQSLMLEINDELTSDQLQRLVSAILTRHDAFRLRFVAGRAEFRELDEIMVTHSLAWYELSDVPDEERQALQLNYCEQVQRSLNIEKGPLFKAVWFNHGSGTGRLLLVAHHLVVDGVSWRIVLADLAKGYDQLKQGQTVMLDPKTSSYQQWGESLRRYARSEALLGQRDYWLTQLSKPRPTIPCLKRSQGPTEIVSAGFELEADETEALLRVCNEAYRTHTHELLLAALLHAWQLWSGQTTLEITMEGHGREVIGGQLDLSETVGWFTSIYPLTLTAVGDSLTEIIKTVKEQQRALPDNGLGYGVLSSLVSDESIRELRPESEMKMFEFNYLGQFDQNGDQSKQISFSTDPTGSNSALESRRCHLSMNLIVHNDILSVRVDYDRNTICSDDIKAFVEHYKHSLKAVIAQCCADELLYEGVLVEDVDGEEFFEI